MALIISIDCCGVVIDSLESNSKTINAIVTKAQEQGQKVWLRICLKDVSQSIDIELCCGEPPSNSVPPAAKRGSLIEKNIKKLWLELGCAGEQVNAQKISAFLLYFQSYINQP
ncbi:hypothetical protein Q9Y03_003970 [Vibrio harveyi]|uniref:hypothetical protein n=1 Tax=Vibrio harveyi TaxID=669 RepID=UPI00289254FD|nr:hypothetical protein [Vibrio harveyi]ELH4835993.1 hypothetical protein [Vibrio harveyi]HDM8184940.1 hypothetical protein [Vibrio harveyi]